MRKSRHLANWLERASLALLAAGTSRCEGSYSLPPTACDDWCFATQRAGCTEDYPEGCVSECEDEAIGRRYPACEAPWLQLSACYRDAPRSAFVCADGESTALGVCFDERIAVFACASPVMGACMEACIVQATGCGRSGRACEQRCASPTPSCEAEALALYACQLAGPADCENPETDTRPPEDIPCLAEIGALLTCAGFTSDG